MPRFKHPLSGTVYERLEDGTVQVTGNGSEGIFDKYGNWISGERRTADPGLCIWVAYGFKPQVHKTRFLYDVVKSAVQQETVAKK